MSRHLSYVMQMPGPVSFRDGNSGEYRYGFQGQEKDDEIKGEGNSVNYKYRMHDPRIGRFFAVDPLAREYPSWAPYVFSGNRVIHMVELEGKEPTLPRYMWEVSKGYTNYGDYYKHNNQISSNKLMKVQGYWVYQRTIEGGDEVHGLTTYMYWTPDEGWQKFPLVQPKSTSEGITYALGKIWNGEAWVETANEVGHEVLDGLGTIPVIGEVFDGLNAIWYTAEGDHLNASLSMAGMIPFVGWGATATKYGIKISGKVTNSSIDFYKAIKNRPDKVGIFTEIAKGVAKENGWVVNKSLASKNYMKGGKQRLIFTDPKTKMNYSLDTKKGTFEVTNKKGTHQGEINFGGKKTGDADPSGGHDLKVK